MKEKANTYRSHMGRFTTQGKAVPEKYYRDFLVNLRGAYGNISLDSIISYYDAMKEDERRKLAPKDEIIELESLPDPLGELFKADVKDNDVYIIQTFKDTEAIKRLQDFLKEKMNYPWIKWEDPSQFHVTLLYLKNPDPGNVARFLTSLSEFKPVKLAANTLQEFPNDGNHALYLAVDKTEELEELQRKLYNYATASMLESSEYTIPEQWTPHITLAYSEEEFEDKDSMPVGGIALNPDKLVASMNMIPLAESM